MTENMKILLAIIGGGLAGWGSAAIADHLGMSDDTADIIGWILWAVFAVALTVSIVRRRRKQKQS